jgi:hypothetical protein
MAETQRPESAEAARKRAERASKKAAKKSEDDGAFFGHYSLQYTFLNHEITIDEDWSGEGSGLAGTEAVNYSYTDATNII